MQRKFIIYSSFIITYQMITAAISDTIKFASFYTIKIYQRASIHNLLIQRDQKNRIPKNRKKKNTIAFITFLSKNSILLTLNPNNKLHDVRITIIQLIFL